MHALAVRREHNFTVPREFNVFLPDVVLLTKADDGGACVFAAGCGEVKFFGQVLPSAKKVTYHLELKRVIERKLVMGIADGSLSVDGREIYTAKDLRVGLFSSTDSF